MKELKWMQENLGKYNNKEYRVENKGFRKITVVETEKVKKDIVVEKAEAAEASRKADQNGTDSCTVAQERETRWVQDYEHDVPEWMEEGLKELKTAEKFLEGMGQTETERKELQGKRIYWESSSRNGVKFLRHGARNAVVQQRATRVAEKEHDLKVELIPIWVGKNRRFTEDESHSTDEWGLQEEHFQQLLRELQTQPTIDGFASSLNTKCARFFSKTAQPGSSGTDFFAQDLKAGEVYYCCPPVKLAAHCIRKLWSSTGVQAILVLPHWTGASYWPLLLNGEKYRQEIKQWRSWQASSRDTGKAASLFTTGKNVQMWAGLVRTGIRCLFIFRQITGIKGHVYQRVIIRFVPQEIEKAARTQDGQQ
jgi:hypothetical protein